MCTNIGSARRARPRSSSILSATRRRRPPIYTCNPTRGPTARSPSLPIPGTGRPLSIAMRHVITAADRIDRTFLAARTLGWEEIECQLPACTPAWGEATTGVPARLIEDAALLYAKGPSLLWMGQG